VSLKAPGNTRIRVESIKFPSEEIICFDLIGPADQPALVRAVIDDLPDTW